MRICADSSEHLLFVYIKYGCRFRSEFRHIALSTNEGSGESAHLRRLTRTSAACLHEVLDWLQSLKQFVINVSYDILVASLTLMALF